MIAKKHPRKNLERKRPVVFTIGLLAACSFTLAAFTYESPIVSTEENISKNVSNVEYFVDNSQDEKVEEVKTETIEDDQQDESTTTLDSEVQEEIEKKKSSDEKSKSTVGVEGLPFKKGPTNKIVIKRKEVKEEVIKYPDKEPEYIGGYAEMSKFIISTQVYPEKAIKNKEQGRVLVRFIVEKDGSVTGVHAISGDHENLKKEAERVVRKFPKWVPAEVDGKRVRSYAEIPITFVLE